MANASSKRHRVLVVDDSPFVRRVVCDVIAESDEFAVAGEARDGLEAIEQVHALDPDLVTLDVEMPRLDGLHALGYVMSEAPRPVVMLSAVKASGADDPTLRALELGAVDFVRKPARDDALDLPTLRLRLLAALRAARESQCASVPMLVRPRITAPRAPSEPGHARYVVVIAASTGGPRALSDVVPSLPASLGAAVVVAQHMPAGFTDSLARRLDALSALDVREARDGDVLAAGAVYVAPGGRQTTVERDGALLRLAVRAGHAVHGVRPAADPLLQSVAVAAPGAAVAVVLTGMGRDGADGVAAVRASGGLAILQDRETAVVYGMPHAALTTAGADRVVALGDVAQAIVDAVASLTSAAAHRGDARRSDAQQSDIPRGDVTSRAPERS